MKRLTHKQASLKKYYLANKERFKLSNEKRRVENTDSFYTLYYLPEEHYIGVTNQPRLRVFNHKHSGRHTLDLEVVCTFSNKKDALLCERLFHSIGYNGAGYNGGRHKKISS